MFSRQLSTVVVYVRYGFGGEILEIMQADGILRTVSFTALGIFSWGSLTQLPP